MKNILIMIQEHKELLLKDLSARLPYGMIGRCEIDASYDTSFDTIYIQAHRFDAVVYGLKEDLLFVTPLIEDKDEQEFANEEVADGVDILDFKPYLRPMSSMTEEEQKEYELFANHCMNTSIGFIHFEAAPLIDWLDKNHFDHRGLIPKGLAVEVTEENNPYKV